MEIYRDTYLEHLLKVKAVSREYLRTVTSRLNKLIRFLQTSGINDIKDVTRKQLSDYQDFILKSGNAHITKRDELLSVALFFRFLHDYDYIKENPGVVIDPPKKIHNLPKDILGENEIAYLLKLPEQKDLIGLRDFCVMSLLYSSMMRTKELFNLKMEDIDIRLKQILVKRAKNKRDRIVHIDGYTLFFLKRYIITVRPWLLKSRTSENLFISATGTDLSRSSFAAHFRRRYRPAIKDKFKKDVSPYVFRHSSATHWLDRGARKKKDLLPYVQRQLGHKSLESTAIYTHVAIEPLREMFKKYHPREIDTKHLRKIPSPDEIIRKLKEDGAK